MVREVTAIRHTKTIFVKTISSIVKRRRKPVVFCVFVIMKSFMAEGGGEEWTLVDVQIGKEYFTVVYNNEMEATHARVTKLKSGNDSGWASFQ